MEQSLKFLRDLDYKSVLRYSTYFLFLGRGLQHLLIDVPYRSFFWNEDLLSGLVTNVFGVSWNTYVTSPELQTFLVVLANGLGILLILSAMLCLFPEKSRRYSWIYLVNAAIMTVLGALSFRSSGYHFAQFMEYGIQIAVPVLYYQMLLGKPKFWGFNFSAIARLAIAFTFLGHGLYAIGFFPVPGNFIDMIIMVLGVNETVALQILKVVGVADLFIFVLALIPFVPTSVLFYASIWGLLTALARVVAHFNVNLVSISLIDWLPLTLYRLPHGMIPFMLYLLQKEVVRNLQPSQVQIGSVFQSLIQRTYHRRYP